MGRGEKIFEKLEKKVFRYFGQKGLDWLQEVPRIKKECAKLWDLENFSDSEIMSANFISFCRSKKFGETVLKIGFPHPELNSEIEALQLYKGGKAVNLYDYNRELGSLLLERISPGENLHEIEDRGERVLIAAEIARALPIPLKAAEGIPQLFDLASCAFDRLEEEGIAGENIQAMIREAQKWLEKFSHEMPPVLLHGDLNHWNILRGKSGWKAIDPKGYRGPACMEAGRFIINELGFCPIPDKENCLAEMVDVFSKKMEMGKSIVSRASFIDKALSLTWKFEEHEPRDLSPDVYDLELIKKFCVSQENS